MFFGRMDPFTAAMQERNSIFRALAHLSPTSKKARTGSQRGRFEKAVRRRRARNKTAAASRARNRA